MLESNRLSALYEAAGVDVSGALHWTQDVEIFDDVGNPLVPAPHQVDAIKLSLRSDNQRFGLLDEPGAGKTVPSIAWLLYWATAGHRMVMLMPPSLLLQYERAMTEQLSNLPEQFRPVRIDWGPAKRQSKMARWSEEDSWPSLVLMSYEMFRGRTVAPWIKIPDANNPGRMVEQDPEDPYEFSNARILDDAGYVGVFADEAHKLKNRGSTISKLVHQFMGDEGEKAILFATGTPVKTDLLDLDGIIRLHSPDAYSTQRSFTRRHCVYKEVRKVNPETGKKTTRKVLTGFRQIDHMTDKLYRRARRVQKRDIYDLEQPHIKVVDVALQGPHEKLYRTLVEDMSLELPDGTLIDGTTEESLRDKALQIITSPENFGAKPTMKNSMDEAVREYADGIDLNETKLLVFCHDRMSNEHWQEALKEYSPAAMYSGNSPKKNLASAERFKEDPDCRILISHPDSGGVGHNFQRVCHNVLFTEPPASPGTFTQASERVARPGQVHPVLIGLMRARGTAYVKRIRSLFNRTADSKETLKDRTSLLDEMLGRS